MCEENREESNFIGYEYHSVAINRKMESIYTDGYENFGWIREDAAVSGGAEDVVNMKFKRDRKIRNKAELTRLQRQFDACANEIAMLEKSKTTKAAITALGIGILGCVFLAGATFSYMGGIMALMVILAVPGFVCWILPYFCYQKIFYNQSVKISPFIDKKHDEIYDICEKGNHLLE